MEVMDTNYAAPESAAVAPSRSGSRTARPLVVLFVLTLAVQACLLYLYVPTGPGTALFPHADKVVHVLLFALPAGVGALSPVGTRIVAAVLALHAPVSEVIQHAFIAGRYGDVWDVVADLLGVGVGIGVAVLIRRRHRRFEPKGASPLD